MSGVLCAREAAHRVGIQCNSRATRSVQKERQESVSAADGVTAERA